MLHAVGMTSHHAVLWIDHHEARIFDVDAQASDGTTVHAPGRHVERHPKSSTAEHNHPGDIQRFFESVEKALVGSEQILIVGPSTAKLQFLAHVHKRAHALEPKIVGVETVDHPTDGQLVAYAKRYFEIPEKMH